MAHNTNKKRILFIMVPIELDEIDIDPYAFRIYVRILRRSGTDGSGCFESIDNMAKGCDISLKRSYAAIKTLIDRKMIRKTSRPGYPSIYVPTPISEWNTPHTHSKNTDGYSENDPPTHGKNTDGYGENDLPTHGENAAGYGENDLPFLAETTYPPMAKTPYKEDPIEEDPLKNQGKINKSQEKKDLINKKSNGAPTQKPSADNGASEGDVPPHKKPSADPGNERESAGEVGEGKKNQGTEGPENEKPETESPETGAGVEKDPEGELDDKLNSTARCEERFRAPWPKGDWGQADRRFLNSPEGIKLRQILNGAGIEPERWVDFLHYWAKESQFANWKGNEAWRSKTDVEKLTAIKNALKAQLKRPDRQDTIMGIVEGFKSRLRLAEATKRKRDAMMNPSTERRVWSKEEILAKYEAIKAEELQTSAK